jgi:hypothetical protein
MSHPTNTIIDEFKQEKEAGAYEVEPNEAPKVCALCGMGCPHKECEHTDLFKPLILN